MAIGRYPLISLTALYKGTFFQWTICLKFQLTITEQSAAVAKATCIASRAYCGLTILLARYSFRRKTDASVTSTDSQMGNIS